MTEKRLTCVSCMGTSFELRHDAVVCTGCKEEHSYEYVERKRRTIKEDLNKETPRKEKKPVHVDGAVKLYRGNVWRKE